MTETKNFKLKLPDPTDMVDVGVLNENFETIDKELNGSYYELDLREILEIDSNAVGEAVSYDLSDYISDQIPLFDAVRKDKNVKLLFIDNMAGKYRREITIPMGNKNANEDGAIVRFSGRFVGFAELERFTVSLMLKLETNTATMMIVDEYAILMENGSEEPKATNVSVVKSDSTVTITATLEDNSQSVTVITIDENDVPTKITKDGMECPISWEGF